MADPIPRAELWNSFEILAWCGIAYILHLSPHKITSEIFGLKTLIWFVQIKILSLVNIGSNTGCSKTRVQI